MNGQASVPQAKDGTSAARAQTPAVAALTPTLASAFQAQAPSSESEA
jgi:hypothetical protein